MPAIGLHCLNAAMHIVRRVAAQRIAGMTEYEALTGARWFAAFSSTKWFTEGGVALPWYQFDASDRPGVWQVHEHFMEVVHPVHHEVVDQTFHGWSQPDSAPGRFRWGKAGFFGFFSRGSRWRVVHLDSANGLATVCFDRTLSDEEPGCHVLMRSFELADSDKSPIAAALAAARRQPEVEASEMRMQPVVGSPFSSSQKFFDAGDPHRLDRF